MCQVATIGVLLIIYIYIYVESIYIIPYQIDEPNFITTNTFSGYLTYMSNDASKLNWKIR